MLMQKMLCFRVLCGNEAGNKRTNTRIITNLAFHSLFHPWQEFWHDSLPNSSLAWVFPGNHRSCRFPVFSRLKSMKCTKMLVPCGPAEKKPEVWGQQADDPFRRDGHVWRRLWRGGAGVYVQGAWGAAPWPYNIYIYIDSVISSYFSSILCTYLKLGVPFWM